MAFQDIEKDTNVKALIISTTLAIIFVAIRTGARWYKIKAFETEDFLSWFGLACFVTMCSLYLTVLDPLYTSQAVAAGSIPPPADILDQVRFLLERFYAIQLLFWLTLWSVKFSLLWMFRRLVIGLPKYAKIWLGIVILTALAFAGCEISQLLSCDRGMKAYFTPGACQGPGDAKRQAASLYYSLTVDVLTDLLIMAIPIRLLWNLQISLVQKINVGIAFTFGIITIVAAIVRAVSLNRAAGETHVIPISWLTLWASIEGLVAIIVNCLPTFAVFFRAQVVAHRTYGSRNKRYAMEGSSTNANSRKQPSIPLDDIECGHPSAQRPEGRIESRGYRVEVTAGSMSKKSRVGRDWMPSGSARDPESSSQESIIGMSSDHVDFILHDKDGVFVTKDVDVK